MDRFPDDDFLRRHGWRIRERKNNTPAVWSHLDWGRATELRALALAIREMRSNLKDLKTKR